MCFAIHYLPTHTNTALYSVCCVYLILTTLYTHDIQLTLEDNGISEVYLDPISAANVQVGLILRAPYLQTPLSHPSYVSLIGRQINVYNNTNIKNEVCATLT